MKQEGKEIEIKSERRYQNYDRRCNARWVHDSYQTLSLSVRQYPSQRNVSQMPKNERDYEGMKRKNKEKKKSEVEALTAMAVSIASFCMSVNISALLMTIFLERGAGDEGLRSSVDSSLTIGGGG